MIRLEVEQNGSAVARLYFYAETGRWDWAADEDAFPNLNKHGLNVHEGFTSIAEAWEDLCTVLGLLGKGAGAEEAPHRLVRGGGEATERVLAVLRAQVVTFAEEVAAGALLEELAAKIVDAALEELPSAGRPAVPQPGEHTFDYCGACRTGNHNKCYEPCLCRTRGHKSMIARTESAPAVAAWEAAGVEGRMITLDMLLVEADRLDEIYAARGQKSESAVAMRLAHAVLQRPETLSSKDMSPEEHDAATAACKAAVGKP